MLIHPDDDDKSEYVQTNKVFKESPIYTSPLTAPSEVTENWCQQNFVVAMTDGQPSDSDTNVSSYLENYYNGTGYIVDDVALAMYEIDLRPDLGDDDEEATNNVTTYVVGFSDESVTSSDLLEDTATNGGGDFLSAETSTELVLAFKTATDSIFAKVASQSGVSFNTSSLTSESAVYSSSFNSSKWSGSLEAYELDDSGDIATDATWDASTKLDDMTYTDRNIFTYNNGGVEFTKDNLSTTQLEDLSNGPEGSDGIDNLINYLSGDRSLEGSGTTDYRTRSARLGDIVNSTTIYVSSPELNWPNWTSTNGIGAEGDNYSTYVSDNADRTAMIYVGANDGMLHAFNASLTSTDAGQEAFAYIPGILYSSEDQAGLHYLADKTYAHQFYVDLTPTVSDVYIENAWHTILIGGLRSGGKGIFALDISAPDNFSSSSTNAENLSLWEFSSNDDSDFGYSYSKPTVAMMANGEWAVIIGNGYNNSGDGKAKLFILFIDQGLDGTWTINSDYIKIDTGIGSTDTPNGLATPGVVDSDGDGVADRVYAGDLQGNMWAFDISSDDESDWEVAYSSSNTPDALFTAKDSSGNVQPITSAPIISKNTNSSDDDPNLLVFFGTGKYIEESDKYTTDVMSYYSILDANESSLLRSDLTLRTLLTDDDKRVISGDDFSWYNSSGWYFDLLDSSESPDELGERVISDSTIINSLLVFTTVIPNVDSNDVCTSNSESWLMAVDLNTGKAPTYAVFDANGDGVIEDTDVSITTETDANGDGVADSGDTGYSGIKTSGSMVSDASILSSYVYTNDADGNTDKDLISTGPSEQEGRLSWEEQVR
ncbi:pilus assembly protein [Psychromonas sp. KJ10-10]|uniref:pilus assembly protein n=1 Tax=Psychromonas sp. KJ10-10 TaxID=3391823 RepID=UPI0039B56D20